MTISKYNIAPLLKCPVLSSTQLHKLNKKIINVVCIFRNATQHTNTHVGTQPKGFMDDITSVRHLMITGASADEQLPRLGTTRAGARKKGSAVGGLASSRWIILETEQKKNVSMIK